MPIRRRNGPVLAGTTLILALLGLWLAYSSWWRGSSHPSPSHPTESPREIDRGSKPMATRAAASSSPALPASRNGRWRGLVDLTDRARPPGGWLSGRLVGPSGTPVACRLTLEVCEPTDDSREPIRLTSENGSFGPVAMPAAVGLRLSVSSPEAGRLVREDIVLLPGETLDLGTLALPDSCRIAGTIQLAGGQPAAAAEITIRRSATRLTSVRSTRPVTARTATDTHGSFSVFGLAPEPHDVMIDHPAAAQVEILGLTARPPAEENRVTLTLQPGREIGGAVLEASGRPIEGATVTARHLAESRWCEKSTQTAQDGSFLLGQLEEGFYSLEAAADGKISAFKKQVAAGIMTLRFRLLDSGSLTGTIAGNAGTEPAHLLQLSVFEASQGSDPPRPRSRGRHLLYRDVSGRFIVPGLRPGPHWLLARTDRGCSRPEGPFLVESGQTRQCGALTIREPARLRGRVLGTDGKGLTAWVVSLPPGQRSIARSVRRPETAPGFEVFTGPDGRLDFRSVLPDRFRLLIRAAGHAPQLTSLISASGKSRSIDLGTVRLEQAATLGGFVREGSEAPRNEILVEVVREGENTSWSTRTDARGHYRVIDLAPGSYTLRVYRQPSPRDESSTGSRAISVDFAPARQRRFSLTPREHRRLDIDLRGG